MPSCLHAQLHGIQIEVYHPSSFLTPQTTDTEQLHLLANKHIETEGMHVGNTMLPASTKRGQPVPQHK